MKLIAGLGNPGSKYLLTRHNIGFMAIDALAKSFGVDSFRSEHKALTAKLKINGEPILLAKPQTYMNLSGESIRPLLDFYQISLEDLLVIHDEVDLPFMTMRFQKARGHGGHNGVRNVHQVLGTNAYARLKLGVGRPSHPAMEVSDYVLQNFSREEQDKLPEYLDLSVEAVETYIVHGFEKAATRFNQRN